MEYYGKCDQCKKEYKDTDKKTVIRNIERCERDDKKAKDKKAKDAKKAKEEATREAQHTARARQQEDEEYRMVQLRKEAHRVARNRMDKSKHFKRMALGKCPFCNKTPCAGTKPKCAAVKAANLGSSMNLDMSDPATFSAQLDFYKKNME